MTTLISIIEMDRVITLAINGLHSNFTDGLWMFFSNKPVWIPLYAAVVAALFWRLGWKRALIFIAAMVLNFVCCDQISGLVKNAVCRLRPCLDPAMVARGLHVVCRGGLYGFFSAHAANSFGFACCSLISLRTDTRLRYRGYAAFIFTWAGLVSISRVFVSMHYFGDILVGAAVGCLLGAFWAFLARRVIVAGKISD